MTAVIFDRVSIVFGDKPELALPLMDQGMSRADIQTQTGQILGVHDCSLTVAEGEILVLMGLSGSGKSTLLRGVNALNPVVRGEVLVSDGSRMVSVTKADAPTLRPGAACARMWDWGWNWRALMPQTANRAWMSNLRW